MPGQAGRVGRFDLGQRQPAHPVGPAPGLPVRTGRVVGAVQRLAAHGVVKLQDRGAAVARVQLHALVIRVVQAESHPHAHQPGALAEGLGRVAIKDQHVAAALLAGRARPGQKPPGRRAGLGGRDDLKKTAAQRKQRVFKAKPGHCRVAVAHRQAEHGLHRVGHRRQPVAHQADLAQAQPGRGQSAAKQ